jgi:hypothetical protein
VSFPHTPHKREPAWSASNTYQYTENVLGRQRPLDGMLLLITFHRWHCALGSRGKKRTYEAIFLR